MLEGVNEALGEPGIAPVMAVIEVEEAVDDAFMERSEVTGSEDAPVAEFASEPAPELAVEAGETDIASATSGAQPADDVLPEPVGEPAFEPVPVVRSTPKRLSLIHHSEPTRPD